MIIRLMKTEDIPKVYEIERECFSDSWSEIALSEYARGKGHSVFVGEDNGCIIAYGCVQQVLDECEILRIAVKTDFRKKGLGALLLSDMIKEACDMGARIFYLEVREHNTPAIGLYKKLMFTESGRRKDYYRNPTEDAILMSRAIM